MSTNTRAIEKLEEIKKDILAKFQGFLNDEYNYNKKHEIDHLAVHRLINRSCEGLNEIKSILESSEDNEK